MEKRVIILCGHYGSGKTNVALHIAHRLKQQGRDVAIADLDIVNPYFRTKDSAAELQEAGIRLICSDYAGSNVDIPALPAEMYALTDDQNTTAVLDIGGDERGALALGRLAPAILRENNYAMLAVINGYRPLTADAASTVEVLREIEYAGGIPFTGIINNSNLGEETTAQDVIRSDAYARAVADAMGLPLLGTTVSESVAEQLNGQMPNVCPIRLQKKIFEEGANGSWQN